MKDVLCLSSCTNMVSMHTATQLKTYHFFSKPRIADLFSEAYFSKSIQRCEIGLPTPI